MGLRISNADLEERVKQLELKVSILSALQDTVDELGHEVDLLNSWKQLGVNFEIIVKDEHTSVNWKLKFTQGLLSSFKEV
jgi:hypothetical protein